ncbi:Ig-like domain-containing protein [uncultured Paludibaculum sp.]|uniref:Ig-like domain-containing protein n=1 Tax=uncultured Paludibaculum sp. TaxID=1765020 RepID=UPI002D1E363E|nr:Ig-like domain-containing protein [uncultured Paludibaculum sp.]
MLDGTQIDVRQSPNCGTFANQIVGSPGTSIQLSTGCTAGVSWTSYTGGTSWLRVNPASGTGPTNVTLVVDPYDAAQGAPVRTATVTIQGNSFTVTQHAKCDLNPTTAALGGGIDFRYLQLTCGTMAPWSTSATPSWLAATNADGSSTSGVGSGIIKIASTTGNTTGSVRSATLTVDGKTISVTQSPTSNVTLNPTTASILAGGQVQFVGYIGGAEQTNGLTWTVLSGPGSFSSPTGLFVAPAIVYPGQNTATIQAKDSLGGGATTATITIAPYAPAQGVSVSPATGTALTQSFQFTVVNATDVRTTEMIALFNSNLSTYENGCAIRVVPDGTAPMANLISIQVNTGSSYTQPISADATSGSVENSQCRVLAGPSSVTTNGNTLTVTLQVEFKPGFIGQKEVGVLTNNSTGAITQMAHVGSWNLSANPASLPPNITITAPAASATVGGASVLVQGWALDNMVRAENVITNVQVYVDNTLQGAPVTMNLSSTICTTYPNRPGCPNVGWSFTWDTRFLTNGAHTVKVVATDYDNPAKTSEATVAVTVYNAPGTPLTVTPASTSARMHYTNEAYTPPYPQFTAKRGSAVVTPVIWSTPYTVGGDRYDGFLSTTGVYTPPAPGYHLAGDQIRITATNPSDSNDKGTAWVRLIGMLGGSGYNLVWLYPGQSVSLPSSLGSVIYSLEPNLGTVNFAGTYTHNATSYTPGTLVKVTATSTGDPNKQETAYVKLQ